MISIISKQNFLRLFIQKLIIKFLEKNETSFENAPTQKTIPPPKVPEYPIEKDVKERKYESFCPNYFLTLQGQKLPKEINPKLAESKVRNKDIEEEVENLKKTLTEMGKEEMRMNENTSQSNYI